MKGKSSGTKKLTKKQLQKKRSLAAKKGWETRRKNAQEKRFRELNPELVGIDDKKIREEIRKELREEIRREVLEDRTAKAIVDELARQGKIKGDRESKIKARLRIVGGPEAPDYYDEVQDIANDDEYLDMTPTEIYTLGFY